MRTSLRLLAAAAAVLAVALPAAGCGKDTPSTPAADPAACPDGKIRFGVEPYESAADLLPASQPIAAQLEQKLGCKVELTITTTYTSEIEAMRAGKLEVGQFGALGYIFARELAKAKVIAT